jgi:hypothetical protein
MAVNKIETAVITSYSITSNLSGEAVVAGNYQGVSINQAIAVRFPALIMIDPVSKNMYGYEIPGLEAGYPQNMEIVDIVRSVTP